MRPWSEKKNWLCQLRVVCLEIPADNFVSGNWHTLNLLVYKFLGICLPISRQECLGLWFLHIVLQLVDSVYIYIVDTFKYPSTSWCQSLHSWHCIVFVIHYHFKTLIAKCGLFHIVTFNILLWKCMFRNFIVFSHSPTHSAYICTGMMVVCALPTHLRRRETSLFSFPGSASCRIW